MSIFSRFLPKRKEPEFKNNIPKEKENIRKTFGVFCHKHHDTSGDKLCPKCTALLATVMTKMSRCPYGITKPICDRCETPCFGKQQTAEFLLMMQEGQSGMFWRHPVMWFKHKLRNWGMDYALYQRDRNEQKKVEAKAKIKSDREKKNREK